MKCGVYRALLAGSVLAAFLTQLLPAETGHDAWLRYAPVRARARAKYTDLPVVLVVTADSPVLNSAQQELARGVKGMLGKTLRVAKSLPKEKALILGTVNQLATLAPSLKIPKIGEDGFWLARVRINGFNSLVIASPNDRGALYGVFALLRKIAMEQGITALNEVQEPYAPVRWVDQWDNLNGTIERGFAGRSISFENDNVRSDLTRVSEYARLLASIGIQGCAINNVNANPRTIQDEFLPQLARVADAFRPWGVQLSVSVDLSSPQKIGGLSTFDPLDAGVIEFWQKRVNEIYRLVPDFGGFVVKADSEGREGPSSYGRTPADAANMLARALKPHNGILFYRAFVYDHHLDWRNPRNDRARAAYDVFHPLDGKFDDNVIIQIKHGPIDFQAREPVSPLFGGLQKTSASIELPIMQEYTGQQRHMVFLIPSWKQILDFDLQVNGQGTPVKDVVAGKAFHRSLGGFVGVVNVGLDENWLGHHMGPSNLYGLGRLAWDPNLTPATIADEWTRLTWGNDPTVVQPISSMLLSSWHTYESYTGPLGAQTLTDILGSHFGPGIESSENNGWGQWHRADEKGIGMDRTVATGTGFVGQYSPPVAKVYESLSSTPDDLLLFFHHVPYTYELHSGKSVIQHIYDSHYQGAQQAAAYVEQWTSLKSRIDEPRYREVLARLEFQASHAVVWRDAINNYFARLSGIADAQGRVGHHPNRIEAEDMNLEGYMPMDIVPSENASGGKGIECSQAQGCTAAFTFDRPAGNYEVDVQYFDQNNGVSKFRVLLDKQLVDEWSADDHLPARKAGADASTRRRITTLALHPGDTIHIEGIPDGAEKAGLDYVEIMPAKQ